jgi:hypothetical protein
LYAVHPGRFEGVHMEMQAPARMVRRPRASASASGLGRSIRDVPMKTLKVCAAPD